MSIPADVVVIGAGVSGVNAAEVARGMGAHVQILDLDVAKLRQVDARFAGMITTVASNSFAIEKAVREADLVIGAVLVPGAKAPKLITDDLVATMRPGSVLVDIAIDQGGCFESSHATTHDNPTFKVHDSIFYCVANMPGAVPRTSTYALTNVTLPVRRRARGQGLEAGRDRRRRARGRAQHARRPPGQRGRRRSARPRGHPAVSSLTSQGT